MIEFEVKEMSCGHCVAAITRAVRGADAGASVKVDLALHRVCIQPGAADALALRQALSEAGYAASLVEPTVAPSGGLTTVSGCCCRP